MLPLAILSLAFNHQSSAGQLDYILEGEVTIREEGGATHTLKAGDVAHFPRGLTTHWHVPKSVKKFFTLRTPEPFNLSL